LASVLWPSGQSSDGHRRAEKSASHTESHRRSAT
jgi:hypothetical protein